MHPHCIDATQLSLPASVATVAQSDGVMGLPRLAPKKRPAATVRR